MAGRLGLSRDQIEQGYNNGAKNYADQLGKSVYQLTPEERAKSDAGVTAWQNENGIEVKNPTYGNVLGYTQEQVDRQRGLADAAAARQAYQQNYGGYDASMRDAAGGRLSQSDALRTQYDALGMQRSAAMGEQPSQAEGLGRNMLDQSLQAQMAGAASARGGGLAQAAAMRNAANQAAVTQAQGSNQLSALRAQEMAQARGAYSADAAALSGAATNIRQGDLASANLGLQRTGLETQNEFQQRQLNQQAQLFHEQQANQIYADQLQADVGITGYDRQAAIAARERDSRLVNALVGATATTGAAGLSSFGKTGSDVRMKEPLSPSQTTMLSDVAAKRAAFLEGAAFGMNPRREVNPATGQPYLPDYVRKDNPQPDADVRDAEWRRQLQFKREAPANLAAMAQANRSMAGTPYAYKPGMTPPGQAPGEPNVGPMAQNLEQSPVAATAVKTDPATGLKLIDKDKALKVTMSGVAALQQQLDALKAGGR